MSIGGIRFEFTVVPWQYQEIGGWHFASVPDDLANEIRQYLGSEEKGFGRLPVKAKIGSSEWKTAIWFDTKRNTYLLPLKAEIRKKENIHAGKSIAVTIWI
jgi:hypothetical protein